MSIGIGVVYILHQCCIGMNHIVRVGGSVFVSLILEWNSSFDVSHCQNPEASVENRKQKESGLRKEMLVSMAMWSMCLCVWWPHACMSLSPSLFFCLSVCLLAAHGAVTCQAPVYMNTLCSKRDKSTGKSPAEVYHPLFSNMLKLQNSDNLQLRFPSLFKHTSCWSWEVLFEEPFCRHRGMKFVKFLSGHFNLSHSFITFDGGFQMFYTILYLI